MLLCSTLKREDINFSKNSKASMPTHVCFLKINKSDINQLDFPKMTVVACVVVFFLFCELSSSLNFFSKFSGKLCPLVVIGKNSMFSAERINPNNGHRI